MKYETETIYRVDYNEFDEAVQKHFGKPNYECVADNEWNNDSEHSSTVSNAPLDDYDNRHLAEWMTGTKRQAPYFSTLLQKMCVDGIIPPGTYLIDICW
jgi:hypothetical protein